MKTTPKKAKSTALLRKVGLWVTIWWGVSGLYMVLVIWTAKNYYVQRAGDGYQGGTLSAWNWAIDRAYAGNGALVWLITIIVLGWIICAIAWLEALKRAGIPYGDGFKDLFLTLR